MCDPRRDSTSDSAGSLPQTSRPPWSGPGWEYTLDDYYVDRAVDLAWLAAGKTQPNPLVGALVVREGNIHGFGYHPAYGEDHAETVALERAGESARGSTLYVTLEPCAHQGNTPPCVDQIIESGVARVVAPTLDPDERVNGRGVRMLREHGIRVDVGPRADRALLLNLAYFKAKLGLGPAVTLKIALTLDGKIASRRGHRDEITGDEARRMVHRLRAVHDGVLVGIDTVTTDWPRLDCRMLDSVRAPVPIVVDSSLRFPDGHPWLGERGVVILTSREAPEEREETLARSGARVVRCPSRGSMIDVAAAVGELGEREVSSVLVEGGAKVFSSFVAAGLWDAMFIFVSPALFGASAVGLAERALSRKELDVVFAGASHVAGDILLSFVNGKTRRTLLERLW